MKDDCYVMTNERTGTRWDVMVRAGELWLDASMLPPHRQKKALDSGQEIAVEPADKIAYVRASFFGEIWPEHRVAINDLARKLGVNLPWPEN